MTPLPPGFGLALDASARRSRGGQVLFGGAPVRVMRLTPAGRAAVDGLLEGRDGSEAARRLGRRLVDAGLAHPRPPRPPAPPDVTVVVPVRDRTPELARCLAALGATAPVIVVDDGSRDPAAVAAVCRRHGARLLRRERCGGPAAARNSGLAAVTTELVAFLDSDCIADGAWIERLAGHFADPLVGAVAPRIRPSRSGRPAGWVGRFAAARCPLDMGPRERAVVPGGPVPYVPTAALIVRRSALRGAFDAALRYGEDVDLVWRLHDAGWRVRYDPAVSVAHAEPGGWLALLTRRWGYGTSAAPLARRHPGRLAPLVGRPAPTVAAGLLLARRPLAAAVVAAAQGALLAAPTSRLGVPAARAVLWSGQGVGHTVVGAGRAVTALAAPALLAALRFRRSRAAALVLLVAPPLDEWVRRRPRLDPLRWTAACICDDAAYGLGVWHGCLAERTPAPLLPRRAVRR